MKNWNAPLDDSTCSEAKTIAAGVPQGSVMGPILFNYFINSAPWVKKVEEGVFAYDKVLSTSSDRIGAIINRLNQAAQKIHKYFNKWKIKLNIYKTEVIIFTKRRPVINEKVCFDGHYVDWSGSVKYLGLILDSKLTFTNHINYSTDKALKLLLKYYPLLNKNSVLIKDNKLNIYKIIVRPAMLYASPVWSMTCRTNFLKLHVQQNKFLRSAGNYRKFSLIRQMHDDLNIETVYDYVKRVAVRYFDRIAYHDSILMRNLKANPDRHKNIRHILE